MTTTGNLKIICLEINILSINRWNNKKNIKEHQETLLHQVFRKKNIWLEFNNSKEEMLSIIRSG